jgi:replicative DNA helicase
MTPNEAAAREAERNLLAEIMIATTIAPETVEAVKPEDFGDHRNALIWRAVIDEIRSGADDAPAPVIIDRLTKLGAIETAGGLEYIAAFGRLQMTDKLAPIPKSIAIVKDCARLRRIAMAARNAMQAAEGHKGGAIDALAALRSTLDEAEHATGTTTRRAIDALLHDLDDAFGDPIKTGSALDTTAPLTSGRMYVIGGRPGHGKTTLTLQIITEILEKNPEAHCFFATCEMTETEVALKAISCIAGQDLVSPFRRRDPDAQLYAGSAAAMHAQTLGRLHIKSTRSMDTAIAEAHRLNRDHGLACAAIDYLSAFDAPGGGNFDTRTREVGAVSRACKALAQSLGCAVLAASQLNRAQKEGERPTLRHLRDSGEIEQDSDAVFLLHRPDHLQGDDSAQLIIAKNRWGELGSIKLVPMLSQHRFGWGSKYDDY